jgi:hypothetical protein
MGMAIGSISVVPMFPNRHSRRYRVSEALRVGREETECS